MKIKIFSRYNVPPKVACPLESGSQVDKDSAKFTDVNFIVKRYLDTGGDSGIPVRSDYNKPIYGDFSKTFTINDAFDLRDSMADLYDELSPDVKKQFKDFNSFLKSVGSASDDDFVKMFTDYSTTPSPGQNLSAPEAQASGVETSGSVQSNVDSPNPTSGS